MFILSDKKPADLPGTYPRLPYRSPTLLINYRSQVPPFVEVRRIDEEKPAFRFYLDCFPATLRATVKYLIKNGWDHQASASTILSLEERLYYALKDRPEGVTKILGDVLGAKHFCRPSHKIKVETVFSEKSLLFYRHNSSYNVHVTFEEAGYLLNEFLTVYMLNNFDGDLMYTALMDCVGLLSTQDPGSFLFQKTRPSLRAELVSFKKQTNFVQRWPGMPRTLDDMVGLCPVDIEECHKVSAFCHCKPGVGDDINLVEGHATCWTSNPCYLGEFKRRCEKLRLSKTEEEEKEEGEIKSVYKPPAGGSKQRKRFERFKSEEETCGDSEEEEELESLEVVAEPEPMVQEEKESLPMVVDDN